ncbi:MAG: TolC family protein [Deltaproteobacteria bacterium]|nr:TolC family protein [Deltaproteobacteria bacterium]
MGRFKITIIITLIYTFITLSSALANQKPDNFVCITMDEAISSALAHNPGISAAKASVAASYQRARQAESGFYPRINLSESFIRTDNPMWTFGTKINQGGITASDFSPDALNSPPALNNYATRLSLNWYLFDGGRTWYGTKQAGFAQKAEDSRLKQTEQEIIFQTIKAYFGLVLAQENIGVVQQALKTAHAHLEMMENRYKNGLTVKSDVLRAKVHISSLDQDLAIADSRVYVARATLNAVMGNKHEKPLKPVTMLSDNKIPATPLDQWISLTHKNRPELMQTVLEEKMANAELKKSKARNLPSLSLNGSYEINSENFDSSKDNYTIGAAVTMNLFSGFGYSAKTEEALLRARQVRHLKDDLESRITLEVRQAYYDVMSAQKRIDTAKTAIDQAKEAMRIVSNRYESGILPVVSLLDAEVAVYEAINNYNRSLYEKTIAAVELKKAAGIIGDKP